MYFRNLSRINQILFFGLAILAALYYGAEFLIPITFAAFLAALVSPVCNLLQGAGLGKIFSSLLCTLLIFVVVGALAYLMFYQLKIFADDLPLIKEQAKNFLHGLQEQLSSATGISRQEQKQFFDERSDTFLSMLEDQLTLFLSSLFFVILKFLLTLVYLFLFLLYRKRFQKVVMMYVDREDNTKAEKIMNESSRVVHHFLWGRVKVMALLAIMYLIAFWIFDLQYMILLTLFGAIITIIPYLGPLMSGILPVIMYMIFNDSFSDILLFTAVVFVIQLIESYLLEPLIIGSEVRISPLAVILAIIVGGRIWGLAGMILFVPLLAIIKIYADHTQTLKPIGILLGNDPDKDKKKNKD
ncbi:hypothetical protein D770_03970 [Flammeovirgaceae bacterium 311]|nr:hypothetical protein D770_03970 [Flammeovirgaceae bacterium 311]